MAKCKKEIADKVEQYQALVEQTKVLYEEIRDYFVGELGVDVCEFGEPFITDSPTGELQNDDEYCDQWNVYEDWYRGNYYHAVEGEENRYVGYSFEV